MSAGATFAAVLWDMDGTLIDSEPLHFRSMISVLDGLGVRAAPELQSVLTGMSASEVFQFCRSEFSLVITEAEWARRRTAFYLRGAMNLAPRTGALEVFKELAGSGVAQAIVSNSDRVILGANLKALSLDAEKWVNVSRSDVARAKPHPEPYLLAARQLGVSAGACVVVEDSLPGVRAGRAAGMCVWYWPQDGSDAADAADAFSPLGGDDDLIGRALSRLPGIRRAKT